MEDKQIEKIKAVNVLTRRLNKLRYRFKIKSRNYQEDKEQKHVYTNIRFNKKVKNC